MARPKHDPDRPPTRTLIIEAAKNAFAADSFANVRLSDIADEVGISRPSVLYHVDSKDDLYDEVVTGLFRNLHEALIGAATGARPADVLDSVVTRFVDFVASEPAFAPIVVREIVDGRGPGRERLLEEANPLLSVLEKKLVEGRVVGDDFPVREAVLQTAMSVLVRASADPDFRDQLWSDEPRTVEMVRALVAGWSCGEDSE